MAHAQRLPEAAEQHLLMRDQPGQPHAVDRRRPCGRPPPRSAPPCALPCPTARRASRRGAAPRSRSRACGARSASPPPSSARRRARSWERSGSCRATARPPLAAASSCSWSRPVVPTTTWVSCSRHRRVFSNTVDGHREVDDHVGARLARAPAPATCRAPGRRAPRAPCRPRLRRRRRRSRPSGPRRPKPRRGSRLGGVAELGSDGP